MNRAAEVRAIAEMLPAEMLHGQDVRTLAAVMMHDDGVRAADLRKGETLHLARLRQAAFADAREGIEASQEQG